MTAVTDGAAGARCARITLATLATLVPGVLAATAIPLRNLALSPADGPDGLEIVAAGVGPGGGGVIGACWGARLATLVTPETTPE